MANYIDLDREQLDEGKVWDYVRGKIDKWTDFGNGGWGQDSLWTKGKRRNYFGLKGRGGIGYDGVAFKAWGALYQYFYKENVERCTPQVVNALRITGTALNGVAIAQHRVDLSKLDNSNMAISGDPGYANDRVADARRNFGTEVGVNGAFWAGDKAMNSKAGQKVRQKARNAAAKGYGRAKNRLLKNKAVNNTVKYAKQAYQPIGKTVNRVGGKVGKNTLGRVGGTAFTIMGVVFEVAIAHDLINAGINWIKTETSKGNPIPALREAILDLRNFFRSYGGYMNMGYPVANGLDTNSVETAINTIEYAVNNSILSYEEWCDMMKRKYPNMKYTNNLNMAAYYKYYNIGQSATPAKKYSNRQTGNDKSNIQENMRYNSKKNQRTFLLTENEIRKIVSESTMAVLNEGGPLKWLTDRLAKRGVSAVAKREAAQMAAKREAEAAAKREAAQMAAKREAEAAAKREAAQTGAKTAQKTPTNPMQNTATMQELMRLPQVAKTLEQAALRNGGLRREELEVFVKSFGDRPYSEVARYFGNTKFYMSEGFLRCIASAEASGMACPLAKEVDSMILRNMDEVARYARTPVRPGESYVAPTQNTVNKMTANGGAGATPADKFEFEIIRNDGRPNTTFSVDGAGNVSDVRWSSTSSTNYSTGGSVKQATPPNTPSAPAKSGWQQFLNILRYAAKKGLNTVWNMVKAHPVEFVVGLGVAVYVINRWKRPDSGISNATPASPAGTGTQSSSAGQNIQTSPANKTNQTNSNGKPSVTSYQPPR